LGYILQQLLTRCIAGRVIPIDMLPDEVLLKIFHFYVDGDEPFTKKMVEAWQTLVHVCRQWRRIVFESPLRLHLQLVCTSKTPARDTLDVWPYLPLFIDDDAFLSEGVDNVVAALECSDRVDRIHLVDVGGSSMEKVLAAMQVPFPVLTHLTLHSNGTVTALPDSFLGGSAPLLQSLYLDRVPIPGLPSLLSHSAHLSRLCLNGIPRSGYFSPEEAVACLSTLTGLDAVILEFESPPSHPVRERRHPPKRSVLPVLTDLTFRGVIEYLEDLVARIDAPQLDELHITFFNQIDFVAPQLVQFIRRTPNLKALERAHLAFGVDAFGLDAAEVKLSSRTTRFRALSVRVSCRELDWQISSLEQLCTSFFPFIFAPEDLYIYQMRNSEPDWKDNVDDALWLTLLHPFTTVKNIHLSKEFAPRILPALQELVGARTTEVLPILQNIFLEDLELSGPVQKALGAFVAARQLSDLPITVSRWERDLEQEGFSGP
jgi:hypothetical protein